MLRTIPGLSSLSVEVIVSEIGIDRSRFPTEAQLIARAGLCPKNDESAGKRRSDRIKKARPGSRPPLSNAPGRPRAKREVTSRLNTCASAAGVVQRRPLSPSPLPS